MKGARAVAGGLLILVAVCLIPAVSAAQDAGTPTDTTTTTTTDPSAVTPPDPVGTPAPSSAPSGGGRGGQSSGADKTPNGNGSSAGQVTASTGPSAGATNRSANGAHTAATTSVNMEDFFFSPASVSVHVGDLVTWHNRGNQPHTATADNGSFDTGTVPAGGSASHMFTQPGTFTYVCTIHPNMHGTVKVLSAGGGGGSGSGSSSSGFSASSGSSESAAVNSPNAGGDKNTLPMSGMAAGALALVGFALLASGFGIRLTSRRAASGGHQLRLF